jgi:hypothetical protein
VGCTTDEQARKIGGPSHCRNQVEIYSIYLKGLDRADIGTGSARQVDYVKKLTTAFRGKNSGLVVGEANGELGTS